MDPKDSFNQASIINGLYSPHLLLGGESSRKNQESSFMIDYTLGRQQR